MTYQNDFIPPSDIMEQIAEQGIAYLLELIPPYKLSVKNACEVQCFPRGHPEWRAASASFSPSLFRREKVAYSSESL